MWRTFHEYNYTQNNAEVNTVSRKNQTFRVYSCVENASIKLCSLYKNQKDHVFFRHFGLLNYFVKCTDKHKMIGGVQMTASQQEQIKSLRAVGYSYRDISNALGIPAGTIKAYCSRMRKPHSVCSTSELQCKQCGVSIQNIPGKKKRHFCSQKCYYLWWSENHGRKRTAYQKTCAYCGTPFSVVSQKKQKYCSCACYHAARKAGGENE